MKNCCFLHPLKKTLQETGLVFFFFRRNFLFQELGIRLRERFNSTWSQTESSSAAGIGASHLRDLPWFSSWDCIGRNGWGFTKMLSPEVISPPKWSKMHLGTQKRLWIPSWHIEIQMDLWFLCTSHCSEICLKIVLNNWSGWNTWKTRFTWFLLLLLVEISGSTW